MTRLQRDFYATDALSLARELLGKLIIRMVDGSRLAAMIVETEAYIGVDDKAAHFYAGRRTPRTEVVYGESGFAYVFFVYGMHCCFNVVAGARDDPQAVLIRAAEPVSGLERMALNRYGAPLASLDEKKILGLSNGPGKLCEALGIDRSFNGIDLCGDELFLMDQGCADFEIVSSKRIGIDYAEEARDYPWRLHIKGNRYVSAR
ncbi:MAG TPA: DNA-3-methyladenine glycosylase [Rectinemataceae bacterium]